MDGARAHDVDEVTRAPRRTAARAARAAVAVAMAVAVAVSVSVAAAVAIAAADPPFNMRLLGRLDYTASCAGVWGYSAPDGTELAIIANALGTSFVDVTEPATPHEVAFIAGHRSNWREVRTWSHYAYIVTEGRPALDGDDAGMQIVDLVHPLQPQLITHWDETFTTAHTIAIHEGWAYLNGTRYGAGASGMRILDLANPVAPVDVGAYTPRYVHDSYVHADTGYLCIIGVGLAVVDLSDRAHPQELAFVAYPGAGTHNAALARDGRTLYTTDEIIAGHLRVWDVSDRRDPVQVGEWSAHPTTSIHNVIVHGDSAYVAYYTEGVHVLDVSDPRAPQWVASYDTYPGVSGGFDGCWGVYVSPRTGFVYASDSAGGLFVMALEPRVAVTLRDFAAWSTADAVELTWTVHRDAGDAGILRLERAPGTGTAADAATPEDFTVIARLPLASGGWRDRDVVPGTTLRYRLSLEAADGARVLGEIQVQAASPLRSRLIGASPNPASQATAIRFDLARPGDVRVRVWDARGRLVRSLGAPAMGAGRHALVWDGLHSDGTAPPAGVYFYELASGAWRASGRVTRIAP